MTRPSARPARYPATARLSAFLLSMGMGGALLAAPAASQSGPSFAEGASVAEQIYQPGSAITTLTLPAASGGSGALSYTLTPAGDIPSGLSFSASARTLTGTPAAGAVVASLTYTVTDANSNTDTLSVTIIVRPEPTITLAASSVTNQESNSYTAVLDAQPASDVTLAITLAFNLIDPVPAGFEADASQLVFTPSNWDTPQTVTLTYTEGIDAGNIFVTHAVSIGGRMTHNIGPVFYAVITEPRLVVSPASLSINEGSSATYTAVFEFLQVRATPQTLTVTPSSSDATVATVGGALSFIHGGTGENWEIPQMITVNAVAVGDADTQGGTATITHTITGETIASGQIGSVAVSVVDADSLRQLAVSVSDSTPEEGGDTVFTVALTGQAPVAMQPVTVDWAVTGAQSADYTVSGADTDGTLSFSGLGGQIITLSITDDALSEGEETLTFTLSNASRADITTASATATIGESDRPISVEFVSSVGTATETLTEGATRNFRLSFAEDVATTEDVLVDWTITFPAASQMVDPADGADFAATSGTTSIAAGRDANPIPFTALADSLNEAEESFIITISNPRGGGAIAAPSLHSSTTVTGTIPASNPVTVSIAGPTPPTAEEGGSVTFRVSINNASDASVSVPWSVNELSDAGIIGATFGTITFASRTTTLSQNIVIPLAESQTLNPRSPTETLTVTLGTLSGGRGTLTGTGESASVTVSFTGPAREFTVTGPATIAETDADAESRLYTITLTGAAFSTDTAVTWTVTHGDTSDADFVAASDRSGMVTFGASDGDGATRTFTITVAGDNESESDETFTVQASVADPMADEGSEFGAAASTTITDDDSRSRVLTVTGPASIAENDDAANGVESGLYTITLTGAAFSTDTVITWTVTHGDTADADFVAASDRSGMETFDAADGNGAVKTFTLTIAGDQLSEGDESFSVQVTVADATADGGTGYGDPALTTITDDDFAEIVVYVSNSSTQAEESSATPTPTMDTNFRVDLNGETASGDVVVSYTIVPGPGFTVDDITETSLTGTVTIDADGGTLTGALMISPAADSLNEANEFYTVTATAAIGSDNLRVINNSGRFTINDNDAITASLSAAAVSEGGAVTVNLDNTPTTQVSVSYTIGVDTDDATINAAAADYSAATGSATFPANTAPAAITLLNIPADNLNEAAEVFTVTIANTQVQGAFGSSTGDSETYTIAASDPITVRIAANAATVNEGAAAEFTVTLSGASAGSAAGITVPYTVSGTTDTPTDANNGSIVIAAGQTTGTISLGIPFSLALDSTSPSEMLSVALGAISAGAGGGMVSAAASPNNSASTTVNYLAAAHTISFTTPATSIAEGSGATYTVTRAGPAIAGTAGIVVSWAYAAGTSNPASAADFAGNAVPAGGSLTFTGSETTKTFTITTAEDAESEPGETFTLSLSAAPAVLNSEGGVALPAAITVTIGESDRPVTLNIAPPGGNVTEGTAGVFTVSFTESVTTTEAITVFWRNLPVDINTDTARTEDFGASGLVGNTVIQAGQSMAMISVTPSADNLNEGAETFTIRITSASGGGPIAAPVIGSTNDAQATIAASDPITVRIAADAATVNEGAVAEFTVTLSGASAGSAAGITVPYTASGTTDTPTDANSGSIVIAAGQTTGTISLGIPFSLALDSTSPSEMLSVALGAISAGTGGGMVSAAASPSNAASTTVNYLSAAHTISFTTPATSIVEGSGATYTVTRAGPAIAGAVGIVVSWAYAAGTSNPASAADFAGGAAPTGGSLTFTGSETTKTFTITTAEDALSEPGETFTLSLSAAPAVLNSEGGVALPAAITVTIGESDRPVTLSIAPPGGNVTEGTAGVFTVSFTESVTTTEAITVFWRNLPVDINTDTARNEDFDAVGLVGNTVIQAGRSTAMISVTPSADNLNEGAETFTIRITSAIGGGPIAAPVIGSTNDAQATIAASDAITVSIAADAVIVNEGQSATFTVILSGASAGSAAAITVPYTASGTTDTPTDANSGSILIAAGQTSGAISLGIPFSPALDDNAPDETLTVTLGAISTGAGGGMVSAAASPSNAASTTVNYLSAAHTISFTTPATSIVEGSGATYTVTRAGPAIAGAVGIVVSWAYAAGTSNPASAADFAGGAAPTGGSLTFTGSETTKTFTITIAEDAASEPGETFTLSLTATPSVLASEGGVSLPAAITVTIGESDRPVTLQVEAPGSDLTEGAAASFTVRFAEAVATTEAVIVSWRMDGLNAAGAARNEDFDAANLLGEVSIAAGQRSVSLPIIALADNVNEAAERFTVLLLGARGGGPIAAPVLHAAPSASADIAASDPVTLRLSGPAGAVREGSDAEFTVALVLTANAGAAATSSGAICAMFTTAVAQSTTLAAGANPNTAANPDIAVRGCDGALATLSATSQATGGIVIPAGQSSAALRIPVRFDNEDEGSAAETLSVTLSGAAHTALSGAATLTADTTAAMAMLQNVNALRTLEISAVTLTGDEDSASAPGGAGAAVNYTVRIQGADLDEMVTVDWSLTAADGANLPGAPALAAALARNHGGEHTPDFGAAIIVETGGGTVNADGRSGTLIFPAGPPTSRTIRVPIMQDALNEGAETLTLRVTDPCPATGVCAVGGGGGGATPALQLAIGERSATIPPSDPAMLRITREGSGTVVSGEGVTYVVGLGSTMLNGESTPVLASTPLMVQVPLLVNGVDSGRSFTVEVPAEESSQRAEVSATEITAALTASGQSGTLMLSLGQASVTGAPGPSGGAAMVTAPPPGDANLPAPVPTASWELTRALPDGREAPEGGSYEVTFALRGDAVPAGGLRFTWTVSGSAASDGGAAAEAADFARAAGYTCGAAAAGAACATFPSGTVTFTAGNTSQTVAIAVRDDSADNPGEGRRPDGMIRAEGFALAFTALSGTDASRVDDSASLLPGTLQVDIPALRANLSVASATAAEGASAVFRLTLSGLVGGEATIQPVTVRYRVGVDAAGAALPGDTATLGADYTAPETSVTIPAGATEGELSTAIAIPLLQDGVLEPRETFTLTITAAEGGGGTIRLVADPGSSPVVAASEITATGTITDDADQSARRRQRVGALVTVLDRQTALLATDAITARLSRPRAQGAQSAQLTLANRKLISAAHGSASAANTAGAHAPNIGLALYGASGRGAAAGAAFGGLGAGLAGAANMGTRTALPSLAEVLNGSGFRFNAAADVLAGFANFASGLEVWGSGGYVDLRSGSSRNGLDYGGESIAAFLGADAIVPALPNLLTGLALGWSAGDLDFTDTVGDFVMRGKLSNDSLSLHPYLGWRLSPHANAWLVLGFGAGSVDIEEREGSGAGRVSRKLSGGDSEMFMFSTGLSGTQQIGETGDLKLRFALTRVQSRVDSGRFDDGALLPKARGRSLRLGGEAEAGRRIALANGLSLRPFGTLRVRLDNANEASGLENAALDWGAGISATWANLGLDGRFAFRRQLNDTGDEEQGVSLDLNFAPGALGQGIAIALQTALQQRRSGLASLNTGDALSASLGGALGASALGNAGNAFGSGASTGARASAGMQHSLSGEIAYGVALGYLGRSGTNRALLTPYGRFDLGNADTRWAAGLRLAESGGGLQLGLEAGLDLNAAATRSYDLLLTGSLRF